MLLFYNKELTKVHELTVSDAVSRYGALVAMDWRHVLEVGSTSCVHTLQGGGCGVRAQTYPMDPGGDHLNLI